jgi:hypothetical protein
VSVLREFPAGMSMDSFHDALGDGSRAFHVPTVICRWGCWSPTPIALSFMMLSSVAPASAQHYTGSTATPSHDTIPLAQADTSRTIFLLDTDDNCRLVVDDHDEGAITPDHAKRFYVTPGSHMVKCIVDGAPDLSWRKVIEAKHGQQSTALISLRALHSQLDEAVARKNEAAVARTRAASEQRRREEQANADRESKRHQIEDIQSRIEELKEQADAYEGAAQFQDDEARVEEQQCAVTSGGSCFGAVAAEADRTPARQSRRDAERINSRIQDLEEQMQAVSAK